MKSMTAWEEASNGNTARLIAVYVRVLERARERSMLPLAIQWRVEDMGRTLQVVDRRVGVGYHAAYLMAPARDGVYGFYVQPPRIFTNQIRNFLIPRDGETQQ